MKLIHIEYQRGKLVVDDFTSVTPSFLNVEIFTQREIHGSEIDFLGIVEYLEEARSYYVTVERKSSVFPEEIIIAKKGLNAN